jgi:hypothetical protein
MPIKSSTKSKSTFIYDKLISYKMKIEILPDF